MARLRWPFVVVLTWTVLLFLMLPTLVAVPVSLTPHRYLSLPTDEISFKHYVTLFSDSIWQGAAMQSLAIAFVVTALSLALGGPAAIGLWRLSSSLAEGVRLLALAPIIVPSVVSALAFYRLFANLGLLDTFLGVAIAHTVLAAPYVLIAVSASLATIDVQQEQASRSLGASPVQTIRWVILPQIVPGLATGAIFAFLVSWDEIVVTLFIAARAVYTLPRKMWDGINERVDPTIAAAATVLFILTLILIGIQVLRAGRREGSQVLLLETERQN
jgi:putative spermidine/putrescine transport system permease protein